MNTFNTELVKRIEADAADAARTFKSTMAALSALPSYMTGAAFSPDFDLRYACKGDKMAFNRINEAFTHAAWSEFFTAHDAHHLILDRERACQNEYRFADEQRRSTYSGVKNLTPFTYTAAWDFFNAHLLVTDEKAAKWLHDVLDRTGKDYRNRNTAFKSKMSLRGLDSYGTVSSELARALYAVCLRLSIDFTFNSFYAELRNHNKIDGTQFAPVEGLDLTCEYHANGNTTLRIGKELVNFLNELVDAK